ncbi:DUF2975 domain-containing protein [Microbulbifer sp. CnH-101-G]|uniref:DUF2975 domain-containing protein n=1 Tax=Microbulbifer sp. CnH-101-G TaxID=3243393 RepID=UPI00403A77C0
MKQNIQVLSTRLRWTVVAVSLIAISILLINYFVYDENAFNSSNPLFQELWALGDEYRSMLLLGQLPTFVLSGLFIYWLWRLFGQYAKGDYFGKESDRCYVWLVWLYGASILVRLLESLWLSYLSYLHENELTLVLSFDVGRLFTLFVLVSVLYILRAAKQIEQENKEFV